MKRNRSRQINTETDQSTEERESRETSSIRRWNAFCLSCSPFLLFFLFFFASSCCLPPWRVSGNHPSPLPNRTPPDCKSLSLSLLFSSLFLISLSLSFFPPLKSSDTPRSVLPRKQIKKERGLLFACLSSPH